MAVLPGLNFHVVVNVHTWEHAVQMYALELQWVYCSKCSTVWLQEVSRCQSTDSQLSLDDLACTYSELRSGYREEYVMYNLPAAALAQVQSQGNLTS